MGGMRRTVVLVASWLAAAVVAVALAWQGVSVVGNQVTDERPPPLAASDIADRLTDATSTSTTTSTPGSGGSASTSSTTSTTSGGVPGSAPESTATTAAPATPPPSPPPPAAETRTYNLVGGTASLRFAPTGVTVVFANPASGFSVSVEPEHGNGVSVEFESEGHESRVDGWWEGGPVDRVREDADTD